jgi:SpoVK/Ycf46/Vps4 family AAA+-type ATPase
VLPVKHRDMFSSSHLYQPPKGVLLFGPPGESLVLQVTSIASHRLIPISFRLRKNADSESNREGSRNAIHQSRCGDADRQMVRRVAETRFSR